MRRLLSADMIRFRKNKTFWIGMLFMLGWSIFIVMTRYSDGVRYQEKEYLEDTLFAYIVLVGCCSAIFCSMFTGTEYSDGTIRNKLIVGHSRGNVYGSNLLISMIAAFAMTAAFLLPYCSLGTFLLQKGEMPVKMMVCYFIISLVTIAAFTSLFHMLVMLNGRKSVSAVICLLVFLGLIIAGMTIMARLDAPEYISSYSMTINGVEKSEPELNPRYLRGMARDVYQFFCDFLPSGQALQISAARVIHPIQLIVYSILITVLTTIGGIWGFSRKDLK